LQKFERISWENPSEPELAAKHKIEKRNERSLKPANVNWDSLFIAFNAVISLFNWETTMLSSHCGDGGLLNFLMKFGIHAKTIT